MYWDLYSVGMTKECYDMFDTDLKSVQPTESLLGKEGYRYWPAKQAIRKRRQNGYLRVDGPDEYGVVTVDIWIARRRSKHMAVILDYLGLFGFEHEMTIKGNPRTDRKDT